MDQRVSFVTLVVADVARSRAFYVDALGWTEEMFVEGEVLMIKVADKVVLSLWQREGFEAEVGPLAPGGGFPPVALAHNVGTPDEVDQVVAEAVAAGGTLHRSPEARDWGGYTGYVLDPDGFPWEIAFNPGDVGQVVLP